MTSSRKETAKSLKAPDKFQVEVMTAMDWAVKNIRVLGYVLVPVVAVVAATFAFQYWQARQKDGRLEEIGKVQVAFDNEARKASDAHQVLQKKIEELDASAAKAKDSKDVKDPKAALDAKAPKDPKAPVDLKLAADKAALQKLADQIKPDHTDSAAKFLEFYKKYPTQPEGWMAGMEAAHIYMDEDKLDGARPLLEEVVEKSKSSPFYQIQGRLALIGLYEEAGDYDKALGQIDVLEKAPNNDDIKPKILLSRGRLQMLKNAKVEAKATLNSIIENHGASPEAQKARSMIALLNG